MIAPLIERARALEASSQQDSETFQTFIKDFCEHDFWVSATTKDHVDGKDLVSFTFSQLEGIDLPVLRLFCRRPEGDGAAGRQAFSGLLLLSLAGRTRFHGVLIDGDDHHTLTHDRLLLMLRLLELEGGSGQAATASEPDPALFHQAAPPTFTRAVYDYCRRSPDIIQCRIGIASSPGQALTLPDFLVLLEGSNLELHRERITALAGQHLSPNQLLRMLNSDSGKESQLQYAAVLKTFPPFYGKGHDQGWWGRLKRRFNPPQVPWIQAEITIE
jgi:hypothetical protein